MQFTNALLMAAGVGVVFVNLFLDWAAPALAWGFRRSMRVVRAPGVEKVPAEDAERSGERPVQSGEACDTCDEHDVDAAA